MQPLSFLELDPPTADVGGDPPRARRRETRSNTSAWTALLAGLLLIGGGQALGHGVAEGDASFLQSQSGFHFWPYLYLGAKHMVTGYDHLLFLAGVVFFLHRLRDVGTYVTLFAVGHSLTLLAGVYFDVPANAYLIDAIIGLSVVYKAVENLGGWERLGIQINPRVAVWVFGLFHGFGLATKLQALELGAEDLLLNLMAFNLGVEAGQLLALAGILLVINYWRSQPRFLSQATVANFALVSAGLMLMGYQLTGYILA